MIQLIVGGLEYTGWKEVTINKGLDVFASAFSLSVTEKWSGNTERWEIPAGTDVELRIDGVPDIVGFVYETSHSLSGDDVSVSLFGRSRLGHLVDCSIVNTGSFRKLRASSVVSEICRPFGIPVSLVQDEGKPIDKFEVNQGETASAAIARVAKLRKLIVSESANGLQLGIRPQNIIIDHPAESLEVSADYSVRYSTIEVRGQQRGEDLEDASEASVSYTVTDETVPHYRPLTIIADGSLDKSDCKALAEWHKNHLFADSISVSATYTGLHYVDGLLFQPAQVARLDHPAIGLNGDFIASSITRSVGDDGTHTDILWRPVESILQPPVIEKKQKAQSTYFDLA